MYEILAAGIISFIVTLLVMPRWIKRAKEKGLIGKDMNKWKKPEVAETGGVMVFLGFLAGMIILTGYTLLTQDADTGLLYIASIISITVITMIAYMDDISGWKKGFIRWKKPLITVIAVIPLIPFIMDRTAITLIGIPIELPYLLYPLILVPIGFIVATNAVNLLGGFNGLEAGLGTIALATLLWFSFETAFFGPMLIAFLATLAFLWFNRFPSRVFPGDTFTYFLGSIFAIFAVLGMFQTATILIMAPYILEGLIKSREIPYYIRKRKPFKPECFGKISRDNSMVEPYKEIWSLTHVFIKIIRKIKGKVYENDVTTTMLTVYAAWCLFIIAVYMVVLS
jgi:UDP-N-acetylglucosamine--dolichyl-phosphate N-acetylglucosaminephosphotransferase